MRKNNDDIDHSPSKRTLIRCMNEVKVTSALDIRFSVTKSNIKKDHHLHTSEKSLRNAFNYKVAALNDHFIVGEELEEKDCDMLSDDAKITVELAKKMSDNDKVSYLCPYQTFFSVNTGMLMHSVDTNYNKRQW